MTTYDFSIKSVLCHLEYNERMFKKSVKGVPSGWGGGVCYLGQRPKYGFFYEPSLTGKYLFWSCTTD